MIDGGPLRTSRPADRQTAYRGESTRYQPEEPQQVEPMMPANPPRHAQQEYQSDQVPPRALRRARTILWTKWLIVAIVLALIGATGWMVMSNNRAITSTIDTSKYQAVFLSNGQVYFGKLSVVSGEYMRLTNVFYLERQLTANSASDKKVDDEETTPTVTDNNFQLLKYSDVLYGSEDVMIISKDDIIRYENLRSDGVVAKAIANRR